MSVVVANKLSGGSQEIYDSVSEKVAPGETLPDGCQVHIAGPVEGGWQVITVWDSEDKFHQFRNEKLIPALNEVAGEGSVAPNVEVNTVYRLLTA